MDHVSNISSATSVVPTGGQKAPQPAGPGNTSARSDQPGLQPQGIEPDVSYAKIDRIGAPSNQHKVSIRHARDTLSTWIARSPSPEIADSNDSHAVDDRTDKRPRPFVFDAFAEDVDGLVNDSQPLAKRQR